MGDLLLTWFGAILFALFIIWDMDAQLQRKPRLVFWLVGFFILFNMFAQTAFFSSERGLTAALDGGSIAKQNVEGLQEILANLALVPGELQGSSDPRSILKIITSSMIHYGWIPLFYNLWFIVLFGHVLEGLLGWMRFLPIALLGLIVPAALEGFLPPIPGAPADHFCGGASGLVYTLIGAAFIVFPRARCATALNYDGRFWGIVLCILLPITTLTARAGLPLTEMIILVGMVGSFLFFQPTFGQLWIPLWGVALYKLLQDLLLIEPLKHDIISNSVWRIGGGLALGLTAGLLLDGVRGFRRVWHEPKPKKRGHGATLPSLKKLEAAAHTDKESARRYLGQRVFVSDSENIIKFYNEVIIPRYPELVLPATEQLSLARLLHSKGRETESLHAYENLLDNYDINEDHWAAWLTTAELLRKVDPSRRDDMRRYLDKFLESNDIMMRDRLEARQILQDLDAEENVEETETTEIDETASEKIEHRSRDGTADTIESPTTDEPVRLAEPDKEDSDLSVAQNSDSKSTGTISSEIETIQLPSADLPTLDFPRLRPRTFTVVNGQPTGEPVRRPHRSAQLSAEQMAETYWKPIEMQSGYKMNDERLLVIKSRGQRKSTEEHSSGHYAGANVRNKPPENSHRPGRLAHIEAIKKDFQPGMASAESDSPGAPSDKVPSNYGVEETKGERPRIRLRSEKNDQA